MSEPQPHISGDDARRTARNLGALVFASIFSKGVLFIWQIVLASWLGPRDYGIYSTIVGLFAIGTSIASFGIGLIAIREIAANPQKIGNYVSAMLLAQTILAALAYFGVVAAALIAGYSDLIVAFTAIAGLSLLVDTGGNIAHDVLLAQERMVVTSVVDILHIILRVGASAMALFAGWGLFGLYVVAIGAGIVRLALLWRANWRAGVRPQWPVERGILLPMLLNASPLALSAFLSLAYQHADKLMTTAIIGETQTGFIGPAFTINFGVIEVLSTTVLVAMYPLMARYHSSDTPETFGFLVEKLARFMLIAALPIALSLSIYADEVIAFIYRSGAYTATGGILRILIWYTLLTIVANVFSQALLIQNRQRLTLGIRVASLLLNVTLNMVLLLRFRDPRGAALASVCAEMLSLALMTRIFAAEGFAIGRIVPGVGRVLLLGCGAGLTMLALREMWFVGMMIGLLVYALGVLFGRVLAEDDWDLLYRITAAMPGGTLIRRFWQRDTVVTW